MSKKMKDCVYKKVCTMDCSVSCIRYIQVKRLLELSNLPEMFKTPITLYQVEKDLAAYKKLAEIKNDIKKFVEKGKNLYICSSICGNAKTSWASKLMLKYFDLSWEKSYDITRGLYVHVPTLLIDLKNFNNRPEYIDRIKEADLVIWDEIACSLLSNYEHEQLLQFIDYRISTKKSNIYTSNMCKLDSLVTNIGGRLASRVYNNSDVIEFFSNDFRAGGRAR